MPGPQAVGPGLFAGRYAKTRTDDAAHGTAADQKG